MAVILNGKELSEKIRGELKNEVAALKERFGRAPTLAVVLVGNDPASEIYVRNKIKACKKVGINSLDLRLPEETTQEQLNKKVKELNDSPNVDGIIVQLPLPKHLSCREVINLISPEKDVDGFHPVNAGKCMLGLYEEGLMPCTPAGVMKILESYRIELQGKNAVMVGHSNIVGKPLANMLLNANATVSVCHVYTKDLKHRMQ
jgi:methylenetetrahydrofolate dehydrogenase (NADP+)/methenyltetrahydrofolate cyclohydrolase